MVRMLAVRGYDGKPNVVRVRPLCELVGIIHPDAFSYGLNFIFRFELSEQECCKQIGEKVTRPDVHPCIFIDLTAEETAPVRPLLPDDFRPVDILWFVDDEGASLSAHEILRFVKALHGQIAESPQKFSSVFSEEAVGVVLNDWQVVFFRDGQDRIHLASDSCVMDWDDGFCPGCDEALYEGFVEVEGVGPDVDEHGPCGLPDERDDRGDECEGRHDDFVTGFQIEQERGHFQRVRA